MILLQAMEHATGHWHLRVLFTARTEAGLHQATQEQDFIVYILCGNVQEAGHREEIRDWVQQR